MARLDADVDTARERIASLADERAAPQLGLGTADFDTALDHAREQFGQFHEAEARPRVGLDDDGFRERLDRDRVGLDELGGRNARPRVGLDDDGFRERLAEDQAGFSAFGALSVSPMLAGLVGGISALLPGLGAAGAGLGLLGGGLGLAFGGIFKALQAHGQAAQRGASSAGQTGAQLAATQFANAVAVQQAQQAVQSAMQQSAQDAKTSAQSIISAEQQVGQAEQQLQDAQFSAREAQVSLTNARIQARLQLQQLNDAQKDSVLSTQAARLALAQAQQQQSATDQNAMSTQLDREQAALAVAQAQRQLTEAHQNQANSAAAADRANKAGVNGSQQVIDAQHAVADSVNAVRNAEQSLMNARKAVVQAEEQAAYQAKRDAQAVRQAQRNVTDTIKEQRLAMAATLASEQGAMAQFGADYQRLTPQAQAFVNQILGAQKAFSGLQALAQRTIIPGASIALRGLMSDLPVIRNAVSGIGHLIGGWLADFGRLASTPAFKTGLSGLLNQGLQFAKIVVPAFGGFLEMLGKVAGKSGAASGLADLLAGLAHGLTGLVSALGPALPGIDEVFSSLGSALADVGPMLGQVIGGLGASLGPVLHALLPGFKELTGTLGSSLGGALRSLGPLLVPVAHDISDLAEGMAPLMKVSAQVYGLLAQNFAPILKALSPLFDGLSSSLGDTLNGLVPLIKPLGTMFGLITTYVIPAVSDLVRWVSDFAGLMFRTTGIVIAAGEHWLATFTRVKNEGVQTWHDMTIGISKIVGGFWSGTKAAFAAGGRAIVSGYKDIVNGLTTPVNFLTQTVYDHGIRRMWDDIVDTLDMKGQQLPFIPPIPHLADGGIVPGRDRGRDTRLVAMRPEEGVLVPEAVRGLGGPSFVHRANAVFGGGGSGGGEHAGGGLLGFRKGGILGWVDRGLHDLIGGAEFAAKLATNPVGAITGLLDRAIGTDATGTVGDVMRAIPRVLIGDLAKGFAQKSPLASMGFGSQGGLGGTATGKQIVSYAESFIGHPYLWGGTGPVAFDCSGLTMRMLEHFGFNPPRTSEQQWDWVQRTPTPVLGGLAFFAGGDGTVSSPGHVGIVTGSNQMVDAYGTGFGVRLNSIYTSSGGVSGFGVPPGGGLLGKTLGGGKGRLQTTYDSGGWLPPGPVNRTGRPEAVLTPAESEAFVSWVRHQLSQGGGTGPSTPAVNFQYFGTQHPTAEMKAEQRRDMALLLGG